MPLLMLVRKDTSSEPFNPANPMSVGDNEAKLLADSNRRESFRPKSRRALKSFRCYASTPLTSRDCEFPETEDILHKGRSTER